MKIKWLVIINKMEEEYKIMSYKKLEPIIKAYNQSIKNENFSEALKLNQIIYQNEFNRYKILIKEKRRLMASSYNKVELINNEWDIEDLKVVLREIAGSAEKLELRIK